MQLFLIALALTSSLFCWAQQESSDELSQKTVDPTAALPSFNLYNKYAPDVWGMQRSQFNVTSLKVTNPYYLWDIPHLFTAEMSYKTGANSNYQNSTQIVDLWMFNRPWGRIGLGADVLLNPPTQYMPAFQSGPALALVTKVDKCNYGILYANFLSAKTSMAAFNLIAGCAFADGWNISTGQFTPIYDYRTGEFITFPISWQVGKVVNVYGQDMQLYINPINNLRKTPGTEQWAITVGVILIASPFKE